MFDASENVASKAGNLDLTQTFRSHDCAKRFGKVCGAFIRYVANGHVAHGQENSRDEVEANVQMEHYRPFQIVKKKLDKLFVSRHLI